MKNNWLDNYNDSEVKLPPNFVGQGTFNGPMFTNGAMKGQFQMGGTVSSTMPDLRPASESTSFQKILPNKQILNTATSGSNKEQVQSTLNNIENTKKAEKERAAKELALRKQASQVMKQKGDTHFTFPNGDYKPYKDMNFREKSYVEGLALDQDTRLNQDEDSPIDFFNPLHILGSMGKGLAQAPYEAQQQNSILPYVTGIGTPLAMGALGGLKPNTSKPVLSEPIITREAIIQPWEGKSIKIDNTPFGQELSPELAPYLNSKTIVEKEAEDASKYFIPKKQMGGSIPGSVGFTYARTSGIPSKGPHRNQTYKTDASAQNGKEMSFYQYGLDWTPKMISENGSVIKDDNGYWNPDNWGHPVEINSNRITMQGVHQPLLGISDTGHTQLMHPGEEYKFKGKKVTEYPMAQNGKNVRQPIIVNNPNDPRLKAYNDSLSLYKQGVNIFENKVNKELKDRLNEWQQLQNSPNLNQTQRNSLGSKPERKDFAKYSDYLKQGEPFNRENVKVKGDKIFFDKTDKYDYGEFTKYFPDYMKNINNEIQPYKFRHGQDVVDLFYKKPVQPVVYQKEIHHTNPGMGEIIGRESKLQVTPNTELIDRPLQRINTEQQPTNYSFHYPIKGDFNRGNPQGVKYFNDRAEWQKFLDENDYNSAEEKNGSGQASGILKKGRNGLRQEQKGLQNLDNLLNFTNYNTPQLGGWMDKYSK